MKLSSRRLVAAAMLGGSAFVWRMGSAWAGSPGWMALRTGAIALIRHADAPGVGDPVEMRLGDCATQRNLDEGGRAQARRIGAAFGAEGVTVGAVLASRWCRTLETAELAFPGRVSGHAAFDSFFSDPARRDARTAEARRVLAAWRGPGTLVAVTHQVNVTALTAIVPRPGEIVVVNPVSETDLMVVARFEV
jgi:phosphohistidine phosphatase SixA